MKDTAHPFEVSELEKHKCAVFDGLRSYLSGKKRVTMTTDVSPQTLAGWYSKNRLSDFILKNKKDVCCNDDKTLQLVHAEEGITISICAAVLQDDNWNIHIRATIAPTT